MSRLPARSGLDAAHWAAGPLDTHCAGRSRALLPRHSATLTKNGEVSARLTSPFLAGAEGLEPSARGFGVDVETNHQEQVRTSVARFLPQVAKQAVLVWCWEEIIRAKTGEKERKIPAKAGNTLT